MARNTNKILEEMNNEDNDDEEDFIYDYDEDAPRYYWGGDDGNEIIFYDDEEDSAWNEKELESKSTKVFYKYINESYKVLNKGQNKKNKNMLPLIRGINLTFYLNV